MMLFNPNWPLQVVFIYLFENLYSLFLTQYTAAAFVLHVTEADQRTVQAVLTPSTNVIYEVERTN